MPSWPIWTITATATISVGACTSAPQTAELSPNVAVHGNDMAKARISSNMPEGSAGRRFLIVSNTMTHPDPMAEAGLRGSRYSTSTGFWTDGVQVSGPMNAVADRDGQSYAQFRRTAEELAYLEFVAK